VCLQYVNQLTGGWVSWPVEANIDVADDVDRIYERGEPINSIRQLNEERRGRGDGAWPVKYRDNARRRASQHADAQELECLRSDSEF